MACRHIDTGLTVKLADLEARIYGLESTDNGRTNTVAALISQANALLNGQGKLSIGGKSWLEAVVPFTESNAQIQALSLVGGAGVVGASRTSDNPQAGSMGSQGLTGIVLNDNVAQKQSAYAGYFEARRYPGAGTTHGLECNPLNGGSVVNVTPYSVPSDLTSGPWISAGRGDTTMNNAVSVALGVVTNGAFFRRGLVFLAGSVDPALNEAIAMADGMAVSWYSQASPLAPVAQHRAFSTSGRTAYEMFAANSDGVPVRISIHGAANNSFGPTNQGGVIDLGAPAVRWNVAYVKTVMAETSLVVGASRLAVDTNGVAFNGKPTIGPQSLPAAATDAATTMALVNAIRTLLINNGLAS